MPGPSDDDAKKRDGELEDLAREEVSLLSTLLAPSTHGEALRQSLMVALGLDEPPSNPQASAPPSPAPEPTDAMRQLAAEAQCTAEAAATAHTAPVDRPSTWPMARLGVGAAVNKPVALVVDDTALVREHTVRLLERLGYSVTAAENGPMALRLLKGIPRLDLLVTDVVMPLAMNGRELAEKVIEQFPEVAVVFVSGFADLGVDERVGLPSSVNLLAKPFTRDEFNDAIQEAVCQARSTPPAVH
ncbi:response regulator [Acuticoccus sp. I52.16.1]|uniref:response regulator n=1 Tax=Acuticoccus sp. I52.16.1 TaxID=2928472 RepID=UPI001FCF993A|nr:response regulator [Acuticoccus sp. I52.16.1]UOM32768.1 response regulator [Acuticoccus sp. I52.16.1]